MEGIETPGMWPFRLKTWGRVGERGPRWPRGLRQAAKLAGHHMAMEVARLAYGVLHRVPQWTPHACRALPGAAPHWPKEFMQIPGIVGKIRRYYGQRLTRFLDVRSRLEVDPGGMFLNPFLDKLFFQPVGA